MNFKGTGAAGRFLAGVAVAAAVAGCAAPPERQLEGTVTVVKVDRRAWNAPAENGLFRLTFDAPRYLAIRREALNLGTPVGNESVHDTERWLLEREAERELRSRGLCDGAALLAGALDAGDGKSGASGIFKCRPPVF